MKHVLKFIAFYMVVILFNFGWLLEAPLLHWKTLVQVVYVAAIFIIYDKSNEY